MSFARTVAEHRTAILDSLTPLTPETRATADALGSTTAAAVTARLDIPAFDNSAMDGYAVRVDDQDAPRTVVVDLPAGIAPGATIGAGEAARIMTGAPFPGGADAIVPHENTAERFRDVRVGNRVRLTAPPVPGAHVRRRGEDLAAGDVVVAAGERLGALQLSAAVASGAASVLVRPRPRVVVVASGDELVGPGEPVGPGQIPESNGVLLEGMIRDADAVLLERTRVRDSSAALSALLVRIVASSPDAMVFTGGASVGAYEVVREVLEPAGIRFLPVAMQPGKPQGYGEFEGIPVFCLPGNPVSVAASFEAFVRPALLRLQGRAEVMRPVQRLVVAEGWRTPPGREQFMPIAIDRSDAAAWTVRPATRGGSASHRAGALAFAEGWAVVPAEIEQVAPGDLVDVMLVP